jgi:hypothetical protein
MKLSRPVILVCVFAAAFAFVESSVVVYLRELYYPEGFAFPLKPGIVPLIAVELARELATMIMLITVAMIAWKTPWPRFAGFLIAFGVWDVFYYIWLKIILNWPSSLLDWDILFLIPIPWIGPVIAPVFVSIVMMAGGWLILKKESGTGVFHAPKAAVFLTLLASALILYTFLNDPDASLRFHYPKPYRYDLMALGLCFYAAAFIVTAKTRQNGSRRS